MECKVTKIDELGEQTTFVYENDLDKTENLINTIITDYMHRHDYWSRGFQTLAKLIRQKIEKSKHFYIWCPGDRNIAYCTRT